MAKMEGLVGFEMNQSLPLPTEPLAMPTLNIPMSNGVPTGATNGFPMGSRGLSVSQNGMDMLRSLSLSGGFMFQQFQQPETEVMWERRPSGRVFSEEETSWLTEGRAG
jgi:hypothetical protein